MLDFCSEYNIITKRCSQVFNINVILSEIIENGTNSIITTLEIHICIHTLCVYIRVYMYILEGYMLWQYI